MEIYLNRLKDECEGMAFKDVTKDCVENLSLENVRALIKKAISIHGEIIVLSGYEPLIHPNFSEIWEELEQISFYTQTKVILITNGALLNRYLEKFEISNILIRLLIQIETIDRIGNDNYEKLLLTLKGLNPKVRNITWMKIILYEGIDNFEYFWTLFKEIETKITPIGDLTDSSSRIQVTIDSTRRPPEDKERFYSTMTPIFRKFINEVYDRHQKIALRCNVIPLCFLDYSDFILMAKITVNINQYSSCCEPQIGFGEKCQYTNCFLKYLRNKINCVEFNYNEQEIYYTDTFYSTMDENYNMERCKNCDSRRKRLCFGGCLKYSPYLLKH